MGASRMFHREISRVDPGNPRWEVGVIRNVKNEAGVTLIHEAIQVRVADDLRAIARAFIESEPEYQVLDAVRVCGAGRRQVRQLHHQRRGGYTEVIL